MGDKVPAWFEGWRTKYESLLVEGLTDGPTYVRLFRKDCPMLSVDLALRPYVVRITEDVIGICGKLAVFPVQGTLKASPANPGVMVSWLDGAFPNLEFPKRSPQRLGTLIIGIARAPLNARKAFLSAWDESDMLELMLQQIETSGNFSVENRKLALRALHEAYRHWLASAFVAGDGEAAQVSTGTEFADGHKILPFIKANVADKPS